jgi:hypothetical protein
MGSEYAARVRVPGVSSIAFLTATLMAIPLLSRTEAIE